MCTEEKIKKMQEMFEKLSFSFVEAQELSERVHKWAEKLQAPIKVDFEVIYKNDDGKVSTLNELDFKRLDDIWGVEINGFKVKRTGANYTWKKATSVSAEHGERLFSMKELQSMDINTVHKINAAFQFLRQYGVDAIPLSGWTWSSSAVDERAYIAWLTPDISHELARYELLPKDAICWSYFTFV